MMLAPTIKNLLVRDAGKLGIDPNYIYAYSIDPNVRAHDTEHLVMLITEIDDTPRNYGSNKSLDRKAQIQIQTFIPQTYDGDTSQLRNEIANVMENRNWYCTMDPGVEEDPTADILVNTMRWQTIHKK